MENELPPKTGLSRLWELLTRDLWDFFRANLILMAGLCPGILLVAWGIWGHSLLVALLGGILSGLAGGPLGCGLCDTLLCALYDQAGFWSLQYKQAMKRSWKKALLPGIASAIVIVLWIFEANILVQQGPLPPVIAVAMLEVLFFLTGIFNYVFPQLAMGNVTVRQVYSNSIRFFISALPRSLAAAAVQTLYWTGFLLFFPRSVPLLVASGFWFPTLLSLMILQPSLGEYPNLEDTNSKN